MKKIITMLVVFLVLMSFANVGVFAAEPVKLTIQYEENVFVDLLNNTPLDSRGLFTQDHTSNNTCDFDKVELKRYVVSDLEAVDTMTVSLYGYSPKYTTTKVQAWLVSNDWEVTDTTFNSVKNGNQILLGEVSTTSLGGTNAAGLLTIALTPDMIETVKNNADDDGSFTIMWRAINTTSNRSDITATFYVSGEVLYNKPQAVLTVTSSVSTKRTEFSFKKSTTLKPSQVVAIMKDNPTVNKSNDKTFYIVDDNGNEGHVFTKFNFSDVDASKIDTAILTAAGYANGGAGLSLYAVTTSWNPETGSYAVSSEAIATCTTSLGLREFSFDVADYLSTLDSNITDVEFRLGVKTKTAQTRNYQINMGSRLSVSLDLGFEAEKITDLSTISGNVEIVAERVVVEGSADNAITAIPIIALYSDGALLDVEIGDAVTLNGEPTVISARIETSSETENVDKISFFLWTSLETLVPVTDSNSIE